MACRAATSIATRCNLQLLCRRLQATNFCLSTRAPEAHSRMIDGGLEAHTGSRRIEGALPRTLDKFQLSKFPHSSRIIDGALPRTLDKFQLSRFSHRRFMPRGFDAPPFIRRVNCRNKGLTFSPEPKPEADVFIMHDGEDGHHYFSAHSVGEDGTIKPKYYLAAPSTLFGPTGYFTGANCNGVFHFHNPDTRANYLWNPTMNWLKTLPLSPDKMHGISRSNVEDYAIWCDQNACQDYKVLLLFSDHRDEEDFELPFDAPDKMMQCFDDRLTYHLELYSSRTNSWRILFCKTGFYSFPPSYGVCLDGVFYWPVRCVDDDFLMLFDFAKESFSTLPLPPNALNIFERRYDNRYRIVEFKGLLGVFVSKVDEVIPSTYDLYVMENGFWRLNCSFNTVGVQRPVCFSRNGEVLYFECLNDELMMYNLATEEMERLGVYCSSRPIELYPAS